MNTTELIANVAEETGLSKTDVGAVIRAAVTNIKAVALHGDAVSIAGFGTFTPQSRAERQGRNPQTGAAITIAASNTLKFKPAKALKDDLN